MGQLLLVWNHVTIHGSWYMWLQGKSATLSSTVKSSQQREHRGLAFLCSEFIFIIIIMPLSEEDEEEGIRGGTEWVL
jgi:hypothetical protein